MQDLKQITSTQKIITLLTDVNTITNVFFVLKYEFILNVVTSLVSLNRRLPSSGLMTLMFSIFYFIFLPKLICFLFTTNKCFALVSQLVMFNTRHYILNSRTFSVFAFIKIILQKTLLSGTFKLLGEVKRIIIY